jgi:GDP-4-dehydro-6-deoxy-D-mannose reductase
VAGLPLVTGATGFAGGHLVESLLQSEPAVAAWSNPRGAAITTRHHAVQWNAVDLLDREAVTAAIALVRPSVIYHCAGSADVGGSWVDPVRPLQINALGTHHLLDALREHGLSSPVLVTGSATVYRQSTDPLTEDSPIGPGNPYAVSKLAQEMVAARAEWCPVIVARSFNHAGPRQSRAYVTSSFAQQIAEIEAGLAEPVLQVGNLDARRDITDVRDTVRAYQHLVTAGTPGRAYNVCSGRAYRVGDLLDTLLGLARTPIRIALDPTRLRPSDNPVIVGDATRIANEAGWRATIPIEQTLHDLLDYWRSRIAVPRA